MVREQGHIKIQELKAVRKQGQQTSTRYNYTTKPSEVHKACSERETLVQRAVTMPVVRVVLAIAEVSVIRMAMTRVVVRMAMPIIVTVTVVIPMVLTVTMMIMALMSVAVVVWRTMTMRARPMRYRHNLESAHHHLA